MVATVVSGPNESGLDLGRCLHVVPAPDVVQGTDGVLAPGALLLRLRGVVIPVVADHAHHVLGCLDDALVPEESLGRVLVGRLVGQHHQNRAPPVPALLESGLVAGHPADALVRLLPLLGRQGKRRSKHQRKDQDTRCERAPGHVRFQSDLP